MKRDGGFTLIELLVVIAIIGLLSSIVLAGLGTARMKSRDAKRIAEFKQIQNALELYYQDYGTYPPMLAYITSTYESQWTTAFASALSPYIPQLPTSYTPSGFLYSSTNSGQKYGLAVGLEVFGPIMSNDGGHYTTYWELGPSPSECHRVGKDWWSSPSVTCP